MGDLDQLLQKKYDDIEANAHAVSNVLSGGHRTAPDMPSADGVFQNGRDLTAPPDEAKMIAATTAAGGVTVTIDRTVEFLHFGFTYLDRAGFFDHAEIDDTDPAVQLAAQVGGRAVQYRAALERETVLLGGFVSAHMAALSARDDEEGTLGKAMDLVSNLLGGGPGAAGKAEPADLNPFVTQITAVGGALDVATISYDVTHQAGIDLHHARSSYQKYLDGEIQKRKQPPPPDAGLLASIPLLGPLLPPEIGRIFALVEKMADKAFDIYLGFTLELTQKMMPVIEQACRDMSLDAITSKRAPVFSVWLPPADASAEPAHLIKAPGPAPKTGIDAIDKLVGGVVGDVAGVVGDIDKVADPVVDFLSREGEAAPGGPFLDQVFAQLNDGSGYLELAGATGLGELACTAACDSFGFDIPEFVKGLITKVCAVHADFLRGVYGQLVTLDPTQPIAEADLVAAGRFHLVSQTIEALAHSVGLLDKIRAFHFKLDLFGPIEKVLSGEALFQRGKELLEHELGSHLDPIIELLMKDFAKQLEGARTAAQGSMTMEVYLAQLPSLYALLFRKTFFPVWDLLVNTVFKGVSDLLDPMTGKVAELANKAKGIVDTVRTGLLRANGVVQTALKQGLQGGLGGTNLGAYAKALGANLDDGAAAGADAPSTAFPLPGRNPKCTGAPIDDDTFNKVSPDHDTWKAGDAAATPAPAAAPAPAATPAPA